MPNMLNGTFAKYSRSSSSDFPDDEAAVDEALEHMFSLCGNAGQERLIADCIEDFFEWAIYALEAEVADGTHWEHFVQIVIEEWYGGRFDKWSGTEDIWAEGWIMVAEQSGYHDAKDEVGEGTGQEFGGGG